MNARLWLAVELVVVLHAIALVALSATPEAEGADRAPSWCALSRCVVAAREVAP
jgi:hypothetical protein